MLEPIARINTRSGDVYHVMQNGEWHLVEHEPYPQQTISPTCDCERCSRFRSLRGVEVASLFVDETDVAKEATDAQLA
jgi:hypothetical protein